MFHTRGPAPSAGGGAGCVQCRGMGAIKPWHIATLCCLVTSLALIGGVVWFAASRGRRR